MKETLSEKELSKVWKQLKDFYIHKTTIRAPFYDFEIIKKNAGIRMRWAMKAKDKDYFKPTVTPEDLGKAHSFTKFIGSYEKSRINEFSRGIFPQKRVSIFFKVIEGTANYFHIEPWRFIEDLDDILHDLHEHEFNRKEIKERERELEKRKRKFQKEILEIWQRVGIAESERAEQSIKIEEDKLGEGDGKKNNDQGVTLFIEETEKTVAENLKLIQNKKLRDIAKHLLETALSTLQLMSKVFLSPFLLPVVIWKLLFKPDSVNAAGLNLRELLNDETENFLQLVGEKTGLSSLTTPQLIAGGGAIVVTGSGGLLWLLFEVSTPTYTLLDNGLHKLSCETEKAIIYYTLDGNPPTRSSKLYTTPIPIPTDELPLTLKARAYRESVSVVDKIIASGVLEEPLPSVAQIDKSQFDGELPENMPVRKEEPQSGNPQSEPIKDPKSKLEKVVQKNINQEQEQEHEGGKMNFDDANENLALKYYRLGVDNLNKGEYNDALKYFDKALEIKPEYPEVYLKKGLIFRRISDADSKKYLKKIYPSVANLQDVAILQNARIQESFKNFNRAIEINPDYTDAYLCRGDLMIDGGGGDKEQALEDYDEVLRKRLNNWEINWKIGKIWASKSEYDKALYYYDNAIKLAPHSAVFYSRGSLYERINEFDKAIEDYCNGLNVSDKNSYATHNLKKISTILIAKGEYDQIISACEQVIQQLDTKSGWMRTPLIVKGKALLLKGNYNEAIRNFSNAIDAFNSKDFYQYYYRGRAYKEQGQYDKAIADFTSVLNINSRLSNALYQRGLIYEEIGLHDKALQDYEHLLNLRIPRKEIQGFIIEGKYKEDTELTPIVIDKINRLRSFVD